MNTNCAHIINVEKQKKVKFLFYLISHFLFLNTLLLKAQDPQFTQFYAAPMYLNPAYTGLTYEHRFVANYRNQWPGIKKTYTTYMASYDYNLSNLNSGLGLNFMQDRAGTAGLTHSQIGLNYAYHLKINKFSEFRMGINLSYNLKRMDFNSLIFNDQLSSGSGRSVEANNYLQLNYMDFGAGALLNSKKYWLGLSSKHLTQPNSSLTGDRVPLPVTVSLHGGYRFVLEERGRVLKRYLSPSFNYKHQQKYDQLDVGVYYYHVPFNLGVWYRGLPFKKYAPTYSSSESLAVLVGFDLTEYSLRVGYSYDITISKLSISNSLGAHEISLIYEIAKKGKKTKRVLVSCPKF